MEGSEKECLFCCFCGTTVFEARIRRMGLIRDSGTRIGFGSRVSACDGMVRQVVCARVKEGSSYL